MQSKSMVCMFGNLQAVEHTDKQGQGLGPAPLLLTATAYNMVDSHRQGCNLAKQKVHKNHKRMHCKAFTHLNEHYGTNSESH
jgi:hypothetical protein